MYCIDDRSTPSLGTIRKNWRMAGTKMACVVASASTICSPATGSNSRIMIVVAPLAMPNCAQPLPAMWNSGMTQRLREFSSMSQSTVSNRAWKLALVIWAPLGRPVVPEV